MIPLDAIAFLMLACVAAACIPPPPDVDGGASDDGGEVPDDDDAGTADAGSLDAGTAIPDATPLCVARLAYVNGAPYEAGGLVAPGDDVSLSLDQSLPGAGGTSIQGGSWTIIEKPVDSVVVLTGPEQVDTALSDGNQIGIDVVGHYLFRGVARDDTGQSSVNECNLAIDVTAP